MARFTPGGANRATFSFICIILQGLTALPKFFLPGCQELSWGNCQIHLILQTKKKKSIIPGPENVAFYSHEKSANKGIKGISWWPDLPHILIIFSYSKTSKLISKIHVMCKVLDLFTTSNKGKSLKMTFVEVV